MCATGVETVVFFFAHNGLLVILKISFQQITEKKNRYTGYLAVLGFSADFSAGKHVTLNGLRLSLYGVLLPFLKN